MSEEWRKDQKKRKRKERRQALYHSLSIPGHKCNMDCHLTFISPTLLQHLHFYPHPCL